MFSVHVCDMWVNCNSKSWRKLYECKACDNTTNITPIQLPYACKLLIQEIMTMSIAPRIITENIIIN